MRRRKTIKVITIENDQDAGKTTLVRHVLRRLVNDGAFGTTELSE